MCFKQKGGKIMPYSYCYNCEGEISDWEEAFLGCKHCDSAESDDPDVWINSHAIKHLIDEINELKDDIKKLKEEKNE